MKSLYVMALLCFSLFLQADQESVEKQLFHAIAVKDHAVIESILQSGYKQSSESLKHGNLLVGAASAGYLPAVKLFLQYGWDINCPGEKDFQEQKTALHMAVIAEELDVIKYLLDKGANVNAPDIYQETPLHLASKRGMVEVVEKMVEKGANINAQDERGRTPLHYGVQSVEVLNLLLSHGANPNIQDRFGVSPLLEAYKTLKEKELAPMNNIPISPEAVEILKKYGARLTLEEEFFAAVYRDDREEIKSMVEAGFPIDTVLDRSTCLQVAIRHENIHLVRFLIKLGADVNFNKIPYTPLFSAITTKRGDIVECLLENGADLNLPGEGGISAWKGVELQLLHLTEEVGVILQAKRREP